MAHRKKLKKSIKIIIGAVLAAALMISGVFIWKHRNAKTVSETVNEPQPTETPDEELPAVSEEPEPTPVPTPEVEESSFTLFMVGDGLIHGAVYDLRFRCADGSVRSGDVQQKGVQVQLQHILCTLVREVLLRSVLCNIHQQAGYFQTF